MYRVFAAALSVALLALPASASSLDDFNQGVEAHNRGDNEAAISALSRALAAGDLTNSDRAAALVDRGIDYERQKRHADAIADFTAVLALDPGRFDATIGRMQAYRANAQGSLAASDCDALIKLRPGLTDAYEMCGVIAWENGEFAKAVPYFQTAVDLGARPLAFAALWLEIARLRAGTPDEHEFAQLAKKLDVEGWPSPIINLYLGKTTPDAVLAAAENADGRSSSPGFLHFQNDTAPSASKAASLRRRRCDATFFVGEWQFLSGNFEKAKALIGGASTYCESWLPAEKELARLSQK